MLFLSVYNSGGIIVLKNITTYSCIYVMSISIFFLGLFLVSPTVIYKILSIVMLVLLFWASCRARRRSITTYNIVGSALILHHIIVMAIERYQSISADHLTPLIIFSAFFYVPVLPDFFTPIFSVLTISYHFWSYSESAPLWSAPAKTFGAVLITIATIIGVRFFEKLSTERNRFYNASITDSLTGLYTFAHTINTGQQLLDNGKEMIVILLDIDGFKEVNDTYGHFIGNKVLLQFANTLKNAVGSNDIIGRLGGDEFIIILTDKGDGNEQIRKIVKQLKSRNYITDHELVPINIGFSYGIAVQDKGTCLTIEEIMNLADKAMYVNKLLQKGSLTAYDFDSESPDGFREILNVLSQKDEYTLIHSLNVAKYGLMLAERIGMNVEDANTIRVAGWLHDIGKIAIPNEILRKPGRLNIDECRIMKNHVVHGLGLLTCFSMNENVLQAIAEHHERYDGTGYPYGRSHGEISIGGRILAIVDAFSAMTIKRVYRAHQLSTSEALEELKFQKGSQFDPGLVDMFVVLLGEETNEIGNRNIC